MEHEQHLPWTVTHQEFARDAAESGETAACCVFVIDESIPAKARPGYSALVMAYARSGEPVTILPAGGAALLIRQGGTEAARIAATRVIHQAAKLGLEHTLRAGVASLSDDIDGAIGRARGCAEAGTAGEVGP